MPSLIAEVANRLREPAPCQGLLYAPLQHDLRYRETRRYEFAYEGQESALVEFIRKVLVDDICQDLAIGGEPVYSGYLFLLDYGMKASALDLEKETILAFHRECPNPDLRIASLRIQHRLYVFGEAGQAAPERFVRDICNPAIHTWKIHDVRASA